MGPRLRYRPRDGGGVQDLPRAATVVGWPREYRVRPHQGVLEWFEASRCDSSVLGCNRFWDRHATGWYTRRSGVMRRDGWPRPRPGGWVRTGGRNLLRSREDLGEWAGGSQRSLARCGGRVDLAGRRWCRRPVANTWSLATARWRGYRNQGTPT